MKVILILFVIAVVVMSLILDRRDNAIRHRLHMRKRIWNDIRRKK